MPDTAKLFIHGSSQAIRLPRDYQFDCSEVLIRKDPESGDIIISEKPTSWDGFFELLAQVDVPNDFLIDREDSAPQNRGSIT